MNNADKQARLDAARARFEAFHATSYGIDWAGQGEGVQRSWLAVADEQASTPQSAFAAYHAAWDRLGYSFDPSPTEMPGCDRAAWARVAAAQ